MFTSCVVRDDGSKQSVGNKNMHPDNLTQK